MKPLTLLSHNVFWFQGAPFASDTPPEPDAGILTRLCALYRELAPDVICLQEVQSREAFEQISGCLGMPGVWCAGVDLPQYGGAVFWQPGSGRSLGCSRDAAVRTQRMWQTVLIGEGDRCLRICNMHLPSARQLGEARAAGQRLAELEDAIRSCPPPGLDVIAGDFNEPSGGGVDTCLNAHGYADLAALAGCADRPTNIGGGRGDFLRARRSLGERMRRYGVADKLQLACNGAGKLYLSDHLPLWTTLEH